MTIIVQLLCKHTTKYECSKIKSGAILILSATTKVRNCLPMKQKSCMLMVHKGHSAILNLVRNAHTLSGASSCWLDKCVVYNLRLLSCVIKLYTSAYLNLCTHLGVQLYTWEYICGINKKIFLKK